MEMIYSFWLVKYGIKTNHNTPQLTDWPVIQVVIYFKVVIYPHHFLHLSSWLKRISDYWSFKVVSKMISQTNSWTNQLVTLFTNSSIRDTTRKQTL